MSNLIPERFERVQSLPLQRAVDLAANEPALTAFLVQVKSGSSVVMEFGALGVDSLAVAAEYDGLKGPGQYLRVVPAARKEEPFPVMVARHEVAAAELREAARVQHTDDWHRRNDARALDLQLNGSGVR